MTVSNVGSVSNRSAGAERSQDAEHARLMFQLMGRLEQILARLDGFSGAKRLPGAMEISKEILVELVEFAEERFDKPQTDALIGQVCDYHENTKRFERMLGGQSWNGFASLIGIKLSYSDEVKAIYQQLGVDLVEIVGGYFQLLGSRFLSGEAVADWQASAEVFLDDLVRRWNTLSDGRSSE